MAYKRIAIRQRYDAMAKKHYMLLGSGLLVGGLIGYWIGKPKTVTPPASGAMPSNVIPLRRPVR